MSEDRLEEVEKVSEMNAVGVDFSSVALQRRVEQVSNAQLHQTDEVASFHSRVAHREPLAFDQGGWVGKMGGQGEGDVTQQYSISK